VIGWARHGMDLRKVWPLAALTIAALLVPAFTGKNVYCSRLCPHGAAQSIAGLTTRKRFALPARWHHALRRAPWLLLIAIWTVAFAGLDLPFANAEPFEAWSSGFRAVLPAVLFTGGLLAAFFVPQAYCHYGCPTGALLTFLTHSPARFTRRDGIAGLLVCAAWGIVLLR
jgi:polyferredoxin